MYERFTDRARKTMQLANQEAQRCNHEYIRPEHILLGLVKEGSGVAASVLANIGKTLDLGEVRRMLEAAEPVGSEMVSMGKLPHTPRAKQVIEQAIAAATGLGHNYVGTEHLMLGLLAVEETAARAFLTEKGITACDFEKATVELLAGGAKPSLPENMPKAEKLWRALLAAGGGLGPLVSLPEGVHVVQTREAAIILNEGMVIVTSQEEDEQKFTEAVHEIQKSFISIRWAILPIGYSVQFEAAK